MRQPYKSMFRRSQPLRGVSIGVGSRSVTHIECHVTARTGRRATRLSWTNPAPGVWSGLSRRDARVTELGNRMFSEPRNTQRKGGRLPREERRHQLLAAASEIFVMRGYHAA